MNKEKITRPLYYNGYISLDERAEIREYIKQLQQALNEIREYAQKDWKDLSNLHDKLISAKKVLQIIDKVGGNE